MVRKNLKKVKKPPGKGRARDPRRFLFGRGTRQKGGAGDSLGKKKGMVVEGETSKILGEQAREFKEWRKKNSKAY